jgi:hypothetical protein
MTATITRKHIEWHAYSADLMLPLGRHVNHDSRSLAYAHQVMPGRVLREVLHHRWIPILDQGQMGDCTTNTGTGAAGTSPVHEALPAGHPPLDEALAVDMYADEEQILYGDRTADNGGDGLTTCKVMKARGYISGYRHALGLAAFLDALQDDGVMLGCEWLDSMDSPDPSTGLVSISPDAVVRGGHEIWVRGCDPLAKTVYIDNSWGPGWNRVLSGSFLLGFGDLERLLAAQGDGTIPLPAGRPAPTPAPPA